MHALPIVAASVALLIAVPAGAHASSVEIDVDTLRYRAGSGEENDVRITTSSVPLTDEIVDAPGVTITNVDGCTTVGNTAQCPAADVRAVVVTLGDLNDSATIGDSAYPVNPLPDEPPVIVAGETGDDTITGGSGVEFIRGDAGTDTLTAGGGNDTILGGSGPDRIDGGPGDDDITDTGGDNTVVGGDGRDVIVTTEGTDTIDGGAGDDIAQGGEGDDTVRGGAGNDRLDFSNEVADQFGGVTVEGGSDTLEGGPGDDVVNGGSPPVVIVPGGTAPAPGEPDVLSGGPGNDIADYGARIAPLVIDLDGVADDGEGNEADNVLPDFETVVGGSESDALTGASANETLDGRGGDDTLDGGAGADTLLGGANDGGDDRLVGAEGGDVLRGGPGDDSLDGGSGGDELAGGGGTDALQGDAGADTLAGGPGLDALQGGDDADTLYGGEPMLVGADGADQLDGGGGDDTLAGGPGNDLLDGGMGGDRIGGEEGRDTVSYEKRANPISVTFDGLPNDGEDGEGDNVAADVEIVLGGAVADTLAGDMRANDLEGGPGEDVVDGGGGADVLAGGTGSDVLQARDGVRDIVSCGAGRDLALIDRFDTPLNCELVDRGGPRRPVLGRVGVVEVRKRPIALRLPGARRFVPVTGALKIPLDASLDTLAGELRLITARARGEVQSGTFSGGRFTVSQRRARRAVTELRLIGGSASDCTGRTGARGTHERRASQAFAPSRRAAAAPAPRKRRMWGKVDRGDGSYVTRGQGGSGTVRGTEWLTQDRCDGTYFRVVSGVVRVRDFGRDRTVTLRAGESYLTRLRTGR